ncbi:MAG: hypothetical protein WCL16_08005 [bacterium]
MMIKTRWFSGAAVGVSLLVSSALVNAQGVGLLPSDTAQVRDSEWVDITAGAVFSDDQQFYGARDTFSILPEFRLFVDLGVVNRDTYDADLGAQVGALYAINLDTEFDNAVRASLYGSTGDQVGELGATLSWIVSYQPLENGVIFYGGLGLEIDNKNFKERITNTSLLDATGADFTLTTIEPSSNDTKAYPLINIGAFMPITEHVNVFAEFAYTDNLWIGVGLRVR